MGDKRAAMFGGAGKDNQCLNDLLVVELRRHSVVSVYSVMITRSMYTQEMPCAAPFGVYVRVPTEQWFLAF